MRSSTELREQLDEAKASFDEAMAELGKAQSLDGREKNIERPELAEPAHSLTELGLRAAQA